MQWASCTDTSGGAVRLPVLVERGGACILHLTTDETIQLDVLQWTTVADFGKLMGSLRIWSSGLGGVGVKLCPQPQYALASSIPATVPSALLAMSDAAPPIFGASVTAGLGGLNPIRRLGSPPVVQTAGEWHKAVGVPFSEVPTVAVPIEIANHHPHSDR